MKVIDAMIKISRGEKVRFEVLNNENHIYSSTNGSYLYDETSEEDVYWFIDEDWLNREIKLIEEDKKIEKIDMFDYFTGYDFDNTSIDLRKHLEFNFQTLNNKINEIINYIMEDKHD